MRRAIALASSGRIDFRSKLVTVLVDAKGSQLEQVFSILQIRFGDFAVSAK
jgi:hypothetical protein